MDAAACAVVLAALRKGVRVFGVCGGVEGFRSGSFVALTNYTVVRHWVDQGGASLGSTMDGSALDSPSFMAAISLALETLNCTSMLILGGDTSLEVANSLWAWRAAYQYLRRVAIAVVPCSSINNVPGTDRSIGMDSVLAGKTSSIDSLKISGLQKQCNFVCEVSGRHCGYLALALAICTGAERVYIDELHKSLEDMLTDSRYFMKRFSGKVRAKATAVYDMPHHAGVVINHGSTTYRPPRLGVVISTSHFSPNYTSDTLAKVLNAEADGKFTTQLSMLAGAHHGATPTATDRILAMKLVNSAMTWALAQSSAIEAGTLESTEVFDPASGRSAMVAEQLARSVDAPAIFGLDADEVTMMPVQLAHSLMNVKKRRPLMQYWLGEFIAIHEAMSD